MFAFGSWQGTAGSQRLEFSVANVGTTGYHCKELPVPRGWNSWFPTWEPEVTIASNCRFPRLELTLPNLGATGYHCKEMPVSRGWNSWFPTWEPWVTIASNFKMIRKHFRYNFMVLLNGPVQNAWFCLMDRYRNVCVWLMARNCRFPKVGTLCCQRGNHRLPLQGTAGSQRMELLVPNLGTKGYHRKQLPVPRGWNSLLPTWEPQVTIARNCRFPEDGTLGLQPRNQRLPLQATAGSRGWNSRFPTWEAQVTIARNCRFPEVGTLGSQPGNHGLPLQATVKMI